ncbi:MAG: hypothetical protein KIT09_27330 [Bryobacteraceae bacterium]|nr:hypothetical protein [Bryobacteraceae bacterium]
MPCRHVVLVFACPLILCSQSPGRIQPGTPASQKQDTRVETVEADHNGLITESKLVVGPTYTPPTTEDRVEWWARRAFSIDSLARGAVTTSIRTWVFHRPRGWERNLDGFAKRYGTREAEVIMGNGIEASVGLLWGEDPRYFRSPDQSFGARVRHAISSGVLSYRHDGSRGPAYARFVGIASARSVSRNWHPNEDRTWARSALWPLATNVAGRIGGNLFREFKPDIMSRVRKRK